MHELKIYLNSFAARAPEREKGKGREWKGRERKGNDRREKEGGRGKGWRTLSPCKIPTSAQRLH